jgi:hypothetical protein
LCHMERADGVVRLFVRRAVDFLEPLHKIFSRDNSVRLKIAPINLESLFLRLIATDTHNNGKIVSHSAGLVSGDCACHACNSSRLRVHDSSASGLNSSQQPGPTLSWAQALWRLKCPTYIAKSRPYLYVLARLSLTIWDVPSTRRTFNSGAVEELKISVVSGSRIMKKVILFHQPGWADCRAAEEFLRQKRVQFESRDIQADQAAFDELVNKWHNRSTATLVINGEPIIGFNRNRDRIDKLLGPSWERTPSKLRATDIVKKRSCYEFGTVHGLASSPNPGSDWIGDVSWMQEWRVALRPNDLTTKYRLGRAASLLKELNTAGCGIQGRFDFLKELLR